MTATPVKDQIVEFVGTIAGAMGLQVTVTGTATDAGVRVDIEGEGSEALLFQRGDALRALQTIVNTAFRRQLGEDGKVLVDCQGFRRDKDAELRQMAKFLAQKALQTAARRRWARSTGTSAASSIWRSPRSRASARRASAMRP